MKRCLWILMLLLCACSAHDDFVIDNLGAIDGIRFGVISGTTHERYLQEDYPNARAFYYYDVPDLFYALKTRKVDVIGMDANAWKTISHQHEYAVPYVEEWREEPYGMIFNKKDQGLLDRYNSFLSELKSTGELERICDKWYSEGDKAAMPDLGHVERSGKSIKVACSGMVALFDFIRDGRNCGLDIEIVERFAAHLGRPVEYMLVDFDGLIASIAMNTVDIGTSSICITPERAKMVNFGDSYASGHSNIIIRKENSPDFSHEDREDEKLLDGIVESFHSNLIQEKRYMMVLDGLYITILISVLSIIFGSVLSVLVCAMRVSGRRVLRGFARAYVDIVRGIPIVVLLMILFYIVFAGLGTSAVSVAIIAFSINFSAFSSEIFRSGLEGVDTGQRKAGIALGFNELQTFRHIVLPQALRNILPVFKGEAGALVKDTSIVGYIAVIDVTMATDIIRSRTFDAFFPLIIVTVIYFVLVWILNKVIDKLFAAF